MSSKFQLEQFKDGSSSNGIPSFKLPPPFDILTPVFPPNIQKPDKALCAYFSSAFLLEFILSNSKNFHCDKVCKEYQKYQENLLSNRITFLSNNAEGVKAKINESFYQKYFNLNRWQEWYNNFENLAIYKNIQNFTGESQNGGNVLEAYLAQFFGIENMHPNDYGFILSDVGAELRSIFDFLYGENMDENNQSNLMNSFAEKYKPINHELHGTQNLISKLKYLACSFLVKVGVKGGATDYHVIAGLVHVETRKVLLMDQMACSVCDSEDDFKNQAYVANIYKKTQTTSEYNHNYMKLNEYENDSYANLFNVNGYSKKVYDLYDLEGMIQSFAIYLPILTKVVGFDSLTVYGSEVADDQKRNLSMIPIMHIRHILPKFSEYNIIRTTYSQKMKNIATGSGQISTAAILTENQEFKQDKDSFDEEILIGIRYKDDWERERAYLSGFDVVLGVENTVTGTHVNLIKNLFTQLIKINDEARAKKLLSQQSNQITQQNQYQSKYIGDGIQQKAVYAIDGVDPNDEVVELYYIKKVNSDWQITYYALNKANSILLE